MCGITGIFHSDGIRTVSQEDVVRMNRTIIHRGPDDEGFFLEGPVGFGVRRLSIVDVKHGHQPLTNEASDIWIAFNGEIYNHPLLQPALISRGHSYRTNCDTETVVHAYEEYGERMVDHLRGMFAFALWDRKKRKLLLYRDRLGIKPLYYSRLKDMLVFSSEVKALLEYGVPFAVEESALECYLRLGYIPGERTLFRNIFRLPPGHYLTAEVGTPDIQVRRYWEPRFERAESVDEAKCLQEFEALLDETVAQHRLGERPQGIFLSGGVDSSSLLAVTAGQVSEPVMTFSVGYEEEQSTNEFPYARRMAKQYGTRHFEYQLSGKTFAESLPKLIWHMDDAVADPAAIPLFFISQLAREHITVVHSGEGADEILGGYSIYKKMQQISRLQGMAGSAGSAVFAKMLRLPAVPVRWRRYSELLDKKLPARYQGVRRVFSREMLGELARNGFPQDADSKYREDVIQGLFGRAKDLSELNQMLFVDLQAWLPDDLLVKADKMTMAASIELRVPFLDHVVVEFASRLPENMKIRDGQSKYLLKRLMRERVPADILHAPKRGFPVPISQWLRGNLYDKARSWLLDSPLLRTHFVPERMERLLTMHRNGQADLSGEIYGLICLSLWHDVFSAGSRSENLAGMAKG